MAHLEVLREKYDIVAVGGNSLGWYTALAAAGALSVEDGLASGAHHGAAAGQRRWRTDPHDRPRRPTGASIRTAIAEIETRARSDAARAATSSFAATSICLGGHRVLAGTERRRAPPTRGTAQEAASGNASFRSGSPGTAPSTQLCVAPVAERATGGARRGWLGRQSTHVPDRRAAAMRFSPWSTDPDRAVARYTATTQVTETFDFTATVRTALREFNPDVLLCVRARREPAGARRATS